VLLAVDLEFEIPKSLCVGGLNSGTSWWNQHRYFLTDVASPGFHPVAGKAKDVAAGAVLLAACGAIAIGILIFGPHVLDLLR